MASEHVVQFQSFIGMREVVQRMTYKVNLNPTQKLINSSAVHTCYNSLTIKTEFSLVNLLLYATTGV